MVQTIKIDEVEYVRKDSISAAAPSLNGLKYAIVRTYSAGVFAGYIESRNGKEAAILNARRLWKWAGAATLSQLAMEGTMNPSACKFPMEVFRVSLTEVIEVLDATAKCKASIDSVEVWKN